MKLIICLDDNNGMMFNNRRQSRDSAVIERIMALCENSKLYMKEYSKKIFPDTENINLYSDDIPTNNADEFCFIEDEIFNLDCFSQIYVFRWNRLYPSDIRFNFDLNTLGFNLESFEDFLGNSHDKITLQHYTRF